MNCSDAAQAARYQMIIMFIISATTSVGSVCTLYMASSYCIDAKCRLRLDRVSKRDKANAWNRRLFRYSIKVSFRHAAAWCIIPWPSYASICIWVGLCGALSFSKIDGPDKRD